MATSTRSKTVTTSETRIRFLKRQVRIALRRCLDEIEEDTLQRVFDQGLDKQYIQQIDVYGLNNAGLCRGHLKIQIDWHKHRVHIREGRDNVTVPEQWMETGAIEIDEMTQLFKEFIDDENLEAKWQITYVRGINYEQARCELGTVPGKSPKWAGKPSGNSYSVSKADEMNVGCYLVE